MSSYNPFVGKTQSSKEYWSKLLFKERVDRYREVGLCQFEAEQKAREEIEQLLKEAEDGSGRNSKR